MPRDPEAQQPAPSNPGAQDTAPRSPSAPPHPAPEPVRLDAAVIGAGFGGMYALHRLRDHLGLAVRAFEAGDGVGGTWYWNRYPGARCDAESVFYSYSFDADLQQEWVWSERYAAQPEILSYAEHVADRLDLRRSITFGTRVTAARYDEDRRLWLLTTDSGQHAEARYLITALGCLSAAQAPDLKGIEDFRGEIHHTAHWPHDGVDLAGKRVAVIGTGSSGIQSVPEIARLAEHLTVFQRTPHFTIPARNQPFTEAEFDDIRGRYPQLRAQALEDAAGLPLDPAHGNAADMTEAERAAELDRRWKQGGLAFAATFADLLTDESANSIAADYVRERIRETVRDPRTAELLTPTDYPLATKRICLDTGYYETYNRDNVTLVSIRDTPIERITPTGIRVSPTGHEGAAKLEGGTEPEGSSEPEGSGKLDGGTGAEGGTEHEFDVIVFATGFDAMTGSYTRMDLRGRDGRGLAEAWREGPRTYLGLAVSGFPNLFTITGPGSPSVLGNMMAGIEQHVDWITGYIDHLEKSGIAAAEAEEDAQDAWVAHVAEVAAYTLYPKAGSWYMGANVEGKPRVFMPYAGGLNLYRQRCEQIAAEGYPGFTHTS